MSVLLKMKTMMVKIKSSSVKPPAKPAYAVTADTKAKTTCLPARPLGWATKIHLKIRLFLSLGLRLSALVASDASHRNTFFFDSGASVHLTHQERVTP